MEIGRAGMWSNLRSFLKRNHATISFRSPKEARYACLNSWGSPCLCPFPFYLTYLSASQLLAGSRGEGVEFKRGIDLIGRGFDIEGLFTGDCRWLGVPQRFD